jgi:hypothetical protein
VDDREELEPVHQDPIEEISHDARGLLSWRPMVLAAIRGSIVTASPTALQPTQFADQVSGPTVESPKRTKVPSEGSTASTPGSLVADLPKSSIPGGAQ